MVIDCRNPECTRCTHFGCLVLFLLAGDFNNEVEGIVFSIFYVDDEVGDIVTLFAILHVRYGEVKIRVFNIANYLFHILR